MCHSVITGLESCNIPIIIIESKCLVNAGCCVNFWSLLMCTFIGADSKVHCFVQLTSVFQPAVRQLSQISTEVDDMPSNVSSGPKTTQMPFCPTLLWIRGLISHSHVCLSWLHPMKAYSCIGLDCRQKDNSSNSALCFKEFLSGWFQELLLSLAKENKSLV